MWMYDLANVLEIDDVMIRSLFDMEDDEDED